MMSPLVFHTIFTLIILFGFGQHLLGAQASNHMPQPDRLASLRFMDPLAAPRPWQHSASSSSSQGPTMVRMRWNSSSEPVEMAFPEISRSVPLSANNGRWRPVFSEHHQRIPIPQGFSFLTPLATVRMDLDRLLLRKRCLELTIALKNDTVNTLRNKLTMNPNSAMLSLVHQQIAETIRLIPEDQHELNTINPLIEAYQATIATRLEIRSQVYGETPIGVHMEMTNGALQINFLADAEHLPSYQFSLPTS